MYIQVTTNLSQSATPQSRATVSVTPHFRNLHQAVLSSQLATPQTAPPSATHTVQAGDNLSRIVREHLLGRGHNPSLTEIYAGVDRVARANRLSDPDMIHPGQQLDLSVLSSSSAPLALPSSAPSLDMTPLAPPLSLSKAFEPPSEMVSPVFNILEDQVEVKKLDAPGIKNAEPPVEKPAPAATAIGGPELSLTAERALEMIREVPGHLSTITGLIREVMDGRAITTTDPVRAPWESAVGGDARLTSGFGMRKDPFSGHASFHDGIDLATETGSPIYPIESGRVTFSGWQTGYGRVVVVEHGNGLESVYAHNDVNHVKTGDVVTKETILGDVGSSGRSTGPHLHLEIRQHGQAVNPMTHLTQESAHPHLHEQ
ncbi:MAG: LysM peptidoglycan-binding domain-containing M23 family metallopeptidase [Candidatus Hydrogenedentes bacterium]|nr:LysM peptidoglycan-binding domain-containing M23 family metallopeptidase [Candidatus Hydrogenedentota bacterium]